MSNFFEKRDPWGNGMALWVLVGMVFLAPLAWWSLSNIDLDNNIKHWLPADDPQAQVLHWFEGHFGIEDRILLSWDGSSLGDPRVDKLKAKLIGTERADGSRRDGLIFVKSVLTPEDIIDRIVVHKIDREEAIKRLQGVLIGYGPLRLELTDAGRENKEELIHRLTERAAAEWNLSLNIATAVESDAEQDDLEEIDEDEEAEFTETDEAEADEELFVEIPEHDLTVLWAGMHLRPQEVDAVKQLLAHIQHGDVATPTSTETEADTESEATTKLEKSNSEKTNSEKKEEQDEPWVANSFFVPGSPIAISVTLSEAGKADSAVAISSIRQAAVDVGIPDGQLHMGGRPVAGAELNQQVKKAAWNRDFPIFQLHNRSVILLSGLVAAGLAYVMLRSFRLATLVLVVSVYTTFLSLALVPATNGDMNMVLAVMPTLLLVLTISAAIHVAHYWKHAALRNIQTAAAEAAKMAKQPCMLASVTTSIGLASLMASPLSPVADFGLYSAIGCLISLIVVLFGLPALLQYLPSKPPKRSEIDETFWYKLAHFLTKYRTPVSASAIIVFVVCVFGLQQFRTETKVIRFFPDESQLVQDYHFLEDNLAGVIPVEMVVRFDESAQDDTNFLDRLELVREIQAGIRRHPEISGSLSLADFQPNIERPSESASFPRKIAYQKRASIVEKRVKQGREEGSSAFLTVAKKSCDLHAEGGNPLCLAGDELWRITAQVAILSDMNYQNLAIDLDEIARSTLKYHPGAGHVVTGMVPLFLRTQEAVLDSLITSFALAFGMIALVMSFLLKSPISGLITMLPNILPVGIVFGLISWCGIAVDIGTMITASVALGIAVDGTLHLLTWFRYGIAEGKSRADAIAVALTHCGPAMWQTSAAVGMGLLVLYHAELLLISRFGWLMAALMAAAFLSDLIFLPALLAGPLGALIEKVGVDGIAIPYTFPLSESPQAQAQAQAQLQLVSPDATATIQAE